VLVAVIDITRAPSHPREVDVDGEGVDDGEVVDGVERVAAVAGLVAFPPPRGTEGVPLPAVHPERTSVTSATSAPMLTPVDVRDVSPG
jgi:hypothetical protein